MPLLPQPKAFMLTRWSRQLPRTAVAVGGRLGRRCPHPGLLPVTAAKRGPCALLCLLSRHLVPAAKPILLTL